MASGGFNRGFVVCILLMAFMFASAIASESICIGDCRLYASCPEECANRGASGECVWFNGVLHCCCRNN
ncbi:hypothetical protein QJS04_geneDACA020427 [Acorus gramineus]|uniref:Uncharacterized protein n=1 Tax=Acorus gramineus TaxID=55184 RepID=A0AAV9BRZ0_ACOGR|nr:hypothetical protein QJS04_geneDACA020427 [Acorus gramineus]